MIRLLLLFFVAVISIWIGQFALSPEASVAAFADSVFYSLLATLILFVFFWIRFELKEGGIFTKAFWLEKQRQRRLVFALLAAVVGTIFIAQTQDYVFKTVWDEHVIANTAQNLHLERKAYNSGRVFYQDVHRYVLGPWYDKRPAGFPFLAALADDILGYNPKHTIHLNAAFSFGILFMLAFILSDLWGKKAATFALACFVVSPLFASEASSGGIAISSLFCVLALILLAARWLERPKDGDGLSALGFLGVFLVQTRYESALYLVGLGLIVLWAWWKERKVEPPWAVLLCPVLLIPVLWQHHVMTIDPALWELNTVGKDKAFSLAYIPEMFSKAVFFFFDPSSSRPNQLYLTSVAIIGAVGLAVLTPRKIRQWQFASPLMRCVVFFIPGFLLNLLMLLCYAFPLDMEITSRLSLPLFLPMAVLAAWFAAEVNHRWVRGVLFGGFVLFLFVFQMPKFNQNNFYTSGMIANVFLKAEKYLQTQDPGNVVYVTGNVPFFDINGFSATPIGSLNKRQKETKWLLEQSERPQLLLFCVESYNPTTREWTTAYGDKTITENAVLKKMWEVRQFQFFRGIIYEIVDLEGVDAKEPEKPIETEEDYKSIYYHSLP
ncbi:MAG: hypothetical protein E1N59_1726 [Puniceicoccaceae bacterium 5H]|nr:MAG: hypothetical protein E1N59_1726 [Puniceicoccaceae bacterium 5H]